MIRVAEFMRVIDRGGIESFVISNLRKCAYSDFEFDFIVTRQGIEPRESDIKAFGGNKVIVGIKNEYGNKLLCSVERFIKFLVFFKKNEYDVIHFHGVSPGIPSAALILAASLSRPRCIILHSHMGTPVKNIKGFWRVKWIIGRFLTSNMADVLISCSDYAKEYGFCEMALKRKTVFLIKNGIDTTVFKYKIEVRDRVRHELGIEDKYVIGSVARFERFKNHIFMLNAFKCMLNFNPESILLLVGGIVEGQDLVLDEVHAKIKELDLLDKVIIYGETNRPQELLNAMDVFFIPSEREGFSVSSLEAQCTGLKVIASDNLSREMNVTGNMTFLSLEDSLVEWSEALLHCNDSYIRKDYSAYLKEKGYDTIDTSKQLERIYRNGAKGEFSS